MANSPAEKQSPRNNRIGVKRVQIARKMSELINIRLCKLAREDVHSLVESFADA